MPYCHTEERMRTPYAQFWFIQSIHAANRILFGDIVWLVGGAKTPKAQKSEQKHRKKYVRKKYKSLPLRLKTYYKGRITHIRSWCDDHIVSKFSHAWLHAHTGRRARTLATDRIRTVGIRRTLSYCWHWKRRIVTLVETDIVRTKATCHAQPFPSIPFFFRFCSPFSYIVEFNLRFQTWIYIRHTCVYAFVRDLLAFSVSRYWKRKERDRYAYRNLLQRIEDCGRRKKKH